MASFYKMTYRTNDGDPVDDENYINKDKLNKYKELINIKIQIHDKLEEFKITGR